MPSAKPVSLHPLSFDEAIKALLAKKPPEPKKTKKKQRKPR